MKSILSKTAREGREIYLCGNWEVVNRILHKISGTFHPPAGEDRRDRAGRARGSPPRTGHHATRRTQAQTATITMRRVTQLLEDKINSTVILYFGPWYVAFATQVVMLRPPSKGLCI